MPQIPHHIDPRHVQAIMMQEHGATFYHLTRRQHAAALAFAIQVCEHGNAIILERLALRYGL